VLEYNEALNGGALYPRFAGARTTIVNSVLRYNRATDTTNGWGGAILAWDGAPTTIETSEISNNIARLGGGIYNFANSMLTLQNNTLLRDNHADVAGGGLYNEGTATLTNVTVSGNSSANDGGGLLNSGSGMATLIKVALSGNSAADAGGGLMNFNTAILDRVTLSGNSAGGGGGLWNSGSATLVKTTLNSNSATNDGGGLTNYNGAVLENVTFSGNWAVRYGGALVNFNGTAGLLNVTFSGNSAAVVGGGIYRGGGLVVVKNTIMANSLPGGSCAGMVTNNGFNLASDTSCGFNYIPNMMLGPLADNGGPTKTHQPLPGSPAIDFVTAGCPPPVNDQRVVARPVGTACDAGAVEYGAVLPRAYLPTMLK
jgi:predicted outer membrane repeat protein